MNIKTLDIIEEGFRKEQEKLSQRRNAWREFKRSHHELPGLIADVQKLEPVMDPAFTEYGWLTISISGDKHKLSAAVRALKTRGYSTSEAAPAKGATSWNPLFYKEGAPTIYLTFTGTSCRRVEVGKKTIEVPIYETVCDEITLDRADIAGSP